MNASAVTTECAACHYLNPCHAIRCEACGVSLAPPGVIDPYAHPRPLPPRPRVSRDEDFVAGVVRELRHLWGFRRIRGEVIYVGPTVTERAPSLRLPHLTAFALILMWASMYVAELAYAAVWLVALLVFLNALHLGWVARTVISFCVGLGVGRRGHRSRQTREVPMIPLRIRTYPDSQSGKRDPVEYAVCLRGQVHAGHINQGDTVDVEVWKRRGAFEVRRGWNATTRVPIRVAPRVSGLNY